MLGAAISAKLHDEDQKDVTLAYTIPKGFRIAGAGTAPSRLDDLHSYDPGPYMRIIHPPDIVRDSVGYAIGLLC